MSRSLRIALREYVATVCTRGFILGLVLAPLMFFGAFIGIAVVQRQNTRVDRKIAVVDHSGSLAAPLVQAAADRNQAEMKKARPGPTYHLEVVAPNTTEPDIQRLELSDRIRSGLLHAFLEISGSVLAAQPSLSNATIHYHAKNPLLDDARDWLGDAINDQIRRARLAGVGVDPNIITNLFAWLPVEGMGLVEREAGTGAVQGAKKLNEARTLGVPLGITLLAMLLILTGSSPLLQSVMEEKSLRIAEVMLGAATPWELMVGKVIGGLAVAMTAMAVYVIGLSATLTTLAAADVIPWELLPWFLVFVMGGILMFGALGAALGAACGDAKDAQHLQLPLSLPVMIPVFLLLPVMKEPQGGLATGLSLFPPFTPLLMLLRLSAPGGIPTWQPWIGLLGVVACTGAILWLGGRIFRVGILWQGKLPKFSEIIRWGFRG